MGLKNNLLHLTICHIILMLNMRYHFYFYWRHLCVSHPLAHTCLLKVKHARTHTHKTAALVLLFRGVFGS